MLAPAEAALPARVPLKLREWSEEEFAGSKAAWDDLLASSDADPLFMSWDWQWRWWKHHSPSLQGTLRLVGVYAGDRLVALAPLYSRSVLVKGVLRVRRMELIGNAWRHPHAAFSDYLDVIARRDSKDPVLEVLGEWLRARRLWDELALCCIRRDGAAAQLVRLLRSFAFAREVDPQSAWCVRLPDRFDEYVERLGSEVRRKLFNQRRKLNGPEIRNAGEAEAADFLRELWRYSGDRWGDASGTARFQDFHLDFARCAARSGRLRLTRLVTREGALSVMYNVRAGTTLYYLQSGFEGARSQGLSPGYLHFGYAIEAAYGEGIERFDLLAGSGRHRDYKRDLLTERVPVVSYHLVRGPLSRALYALYEAVAKCRDSLHF